MMMGKYVVPHRAIVYLRNEGKHQLPEHAHRWAIVGEFVGGK